jgi:hypothetical protein
MSRNPASILRGVIAVHFDTVDLITRRLLSFIGEKVLKGFPAGADANASAPVVLVAVMSGIRTAGPHVEPGSIGRGWLRVTVFQRVRALSKTSAAPCMAVAKVLRNHYHFLATVRTAALAIAKPVRIAIALVGSGYALFNDQASKPLAC